MTIVGLHHVQVAAPAGCESSARHYYGELLGLEELEKPPVLAARGGVWFRLGERELHVGVSGEFAPATKAHPGILMESVATLDALAARLESAGIAVVWADERELPGYRRLYVSDPFGNRLELLAPLT